MNHLKLRLGLLEHIEAGKLLGLHLNVYTYLLLKAQEKKPSYGIALSNAPIIASILRKSVKATQDAFSLMRKKKYIYYPDTRGIRGPYPIFINNFEIFFYVPEMGQYVSYFTNIWNVDNCFIGRDIFFARIKSRKIRSNIRLSAGFIEGFIAGLSNAEMDLWKGFKRDFQQDFVNMSELIDKYINYPFIRKYITDFKGDIERGFQQDLKSFPYIDIDIDIDKELKDSNKFLTNQG